MYKIKNNLGKFILIVVTIILMVLTVVILQDSKVSLKQYKIFETTRMDINETDIETNISKELDLNIWENKAAEFSTEEDLEKLEETESELKNEISSRSIDEELDPGMCNSSGSREQSVKVDIGYDSEYADRNYYGYTNEYGQLVKVEAQDIILQNDDKEDVTSDGRYCESKDMSNVEGTESSDYDRGHAIADSLGGSSSAYNITPQNATLNQKGEQYQMEDEIRGYEVSGHDVKNFVYYIVYPDTKTQIPSNYYGSYDVDGQTITFAFDNVA